MPRTNQSGPSYLPHEEPPVDSVEEEPVEEEETEETKEEEVKEDEAFTGFDFLSESPKVEDK